MRKLPSHLAVAVIALLVGAVSAAGAAKLITGKQIKNGSIEAVDLSAKARKALTGARGPAGPAGPTGPAGPQGATGQPGGPGTNGANGTNGSSGTNGANGEAGPALLVGLMSVNQAGDAFAIPGGSAVGTENGAQLPVPQGAGLTAGQLSARVTAAVPAGQTIMVKVRRTPQGGSIADTLLQCTITGPATSCSSAENATTPLNPGDTFSMKTTGSAMAPNTAAVYSMRLVYA